MPNVKELFLIACKYFAWLTLFALIGLPLCVYATASVKLSMFSLCPSSTISVTSLNVVLLIFSPLCAFDSKISIICSSIFTLSSSPTNFNPSASLATEIPNLVDRYLILLSYSPKTSLNCSVVYSLRLIIISSIINSLFCFIKNIQIFYSFNFFYLIVFHKQFCIQIQACNKLAVALIL